jgi:Amt family ammonium transporter
MNLDGQVSFALALMFILLVPFAIAGLALINTGLGRSRSAAHAMTTALCVVAVAILVYFICGFAMQGSGNAQTFPPEPKTEPQLFLHGIRWGSLSSMSVLLWIEAAGLASLIPLGAASDRWRLGPACASTALFSACTFPVFARLSQGLWVAGGQIHDPGGSGIINVTGGLTALAVAWLLGPRSGKYSANGMPAAIPAHNGVFVLFGCLLAWVGWIGLNAAGAIVNSALPSSEISARSVLAILNTTVAAAAAALTAAITTRIRFRRPDASLIANGWMAGLVASSAGCATLKPATAILTGIIAGVLVVISVEWFELHLKVDDPCGSVSVHAVCGLWGLLAAGIFVGSAGQFTAQMVGIATLLGLIFPLTYGLNWLLNRFIWYRVSPDGERQGLDLHELGADAYPEFVVHSDEFLQR